MCGSRNTHTHCMGGHWKFQGGWGVSKAKFLKESRKLNWNFWRGGGGIKVKTKKPSMREVWIFSLTTQRQSCCRNSLVLRTV